jgi:hypothetical protein
MLGIIYPLIWIGFQGFKDIYILDFHRGGSREHHITSLQQCIYTWSDVLTHGSVCFFYFDIDLSQDKFSLFHIDYKKYQFFMKLDEHKYIMDMYMYMSIFFVNSFLILKNMILW